jgi:xylulokinase
MASSFVAARLTGTWMLDHHSASQCDPLYDLAAGGWNDAWADTVVPGLTLPPLHWPGDVVGTVHAAGAAATGLPLGTPVVAGTIDAWAEAVSVGVRAPGDLMLMYGSTTFIVLVATRPATSPAVWTTAGVDPGTLTWAAGTATSGSITAWLQDLAGGLPFADLTREAASVPAGAGGLLLLPYFAGERTPIHDPSARGVLVGLTLRHTRGHLYRAALEATAFAVRHILETIADSRATRVVAVGGGTRGALWTSIVSDVCGVTQEVPAVTVGAAYGDALLAGQGVGLVTDASAWTSIVGRVEPRQEHRGRYDELYGLYRGLYPATRDTAHALAALQHADARRPDG